MKVVLFLVCIISLSACSPSLKVQTDYDPDYDLWSYASFDWARVDSSVIRNPQYYTDLNERRIKEAVMRQLSKRGYQLTNDKPDLLIQYHIVVEDKTAIATEPFGYVYGPYWMQSKQNTYHYTQGTLILDLTDTRINQLIWRGWAVSDVDGGDSPEEINALVNAAVRKMFDTFPKRKTNKL
ncbi:MAG TPA: DUF4136 domain-containing protein [Cyclobacteriaceae bacterium]|nr:DUF4136 domain-containing protein [Cyclobacteriaceae bacterium]